MYSRQIFLVVFLAIFVSCVLSDDPVGVCLRNCAQCKKMFGTYFEGQLCAESCVKFQGKTIPDCVDVGSISPFLTRFE